MELVVITAECIMQDEAAALNMLFKHGLGRLHLRKPYAVEDELRDLLTDIEPAFRGMVVLHDHFQLVSEFGLAGVHLNGRNPEPPEYHGAHMSRSCHSLAEVAAADGKYAYVFLSPVFDSISKSGYGQAFTETELLAAKYDGIINEHVFALGGVGEDNIQDIAGMGFGGVAILGSLWQEYLKDNDTEALRNRFLRLKAAVEI